MTEVMSANLEGEIENVGDLRFLRAEWWTPGSRFVVLRYALGHDEEPLGLRLDLDKEAILDSTGDARLDTGVRAKAPAISSLVARAKPSIEEALAAGPAASPA